MEIFKDWDPKYNIGVEDIDLQHRYFFRLIDRLTNELKENDNKNYLFRLLEELKMYSKFHFLSEENTMGRLEFPDLPNHKAHHVDLLEKLNIQCGMFETGMAHSSAMISFLQEWFKEHTMREDQKLRIFLEGSE